MSLLPKITLLAALASLSLACGGSQDAGPQPTSMPSEEASDEIAGADEVEAEPEQVEENASIRFVHASGASPIRVSDAEGVLTEAPIASGQWDVERISVPAGSHTLTFAPSGGGEAFATADVELAADGSYTAFFIGDHTSVIRAEMPQVLLAEDDLSPADSGQAKVRFVHALPGGPSVSFSDGAGRGYAAGLGYGSASSWYAVGPAANTVEIAAEGETIATLSVPVTAGMLTTVVCVPEGDGVGALFINEPAVVQYDPSLSVE